MRQASVQVSTEPAQFQGHKNHCNTISNCKWSILQPDLWGLCLESDHHNCQRLPFFSENVGNGLRLEDALEINELSCYLLSCSRENWQRKGRKRPRLLSSLVSDTVCTGCLTQIFSLTHHNQPAKCTFFSPLYTQGKGNSGQLRLKAPCLISDRVRDGFLQSPFSFPRSFYFFSDV